MTHSDTTVFVPLREMQQQVENLFPNQNSFRWFVRHHRDGLAKNVAMIQVANRLLFDPSAFKEYVIRHGAERVGYEA